MSAPQKTKAGPEKIDVTVCAIVAITEHVTRFEFTRADGTDFPPFSGGAHTVVSMDGRGGSVFMHTQVAVGDAMSITYPVNLFSLDLRAQKHVFFAGGIGITPFLSMIGQLEQSNGNWELHYAARTPESAAYADVLMAKFPNKVHVYYSGQDVRIPLTELLVGQPLGTHAYVCGPTGFTDLVRDTAAGIGWPESHVHSEEFLAPSPGAPFEVRLCKSDKTITVGEHESLLEAMEREGVDAPFLCRGGSCGQCETDVINATGEFDHRDHWLDEEELTKGKKIMPCVSRFLGPHLELDR